MNDEAIMEVVKNAVKIVRGCKGRWNRKQVQE